MGFLNIELSEEELFLQPCVDEFNKYCERGGYPNVLESTHYELAKLTDLPDVDLWKKFLQNKKVIEWFDSEQQIQIRAKVQKIIRSESGHSTAAIQELNALLAQLKERNSNTSNTPIIIYNFIPLTEEEMKDKQVNVVSSIPSGIKSAIRVVGNNSNNN